MAIEKIFIDTSAFYALIDHSDNYHHSASKLWAYFLDKGYYLKTINYVTVETLALSQNRLGFEAADLWSRDVLDIVEALWIDKVLHHVDPRQGSGNSGFSGKPGPAPQDFCPLGGKLSLH